MKKENNRGVIICLIFVIIILIMFIVLLVTGTISFKNKSVKIIDDIENNNIINNDTSLNDIVGEYTTTLKDFGGETNENSTYILLKLYKNGMFTYTLTSHVKSGALGNYIIDGKNITLNYLFNTGNDSSLKSTKGMKTLIINENGDIIDSDIKNDVLIENKINSVKLSKSSSIVDEYDLSSYFKDEEYEKKYNIPSVFKPNI